MASVPWSRRPPLQHKSPTARFAISGIRGKVFHIQTAADSSCSAERSALRACRSIQQNSTRSILDLGISEEHGKCIATTYQQEQLDAAPHQSRYLVWPSANIHDRNMLLDRAQKSLNTRCEEISLSMRLDISDFIGKPKDVTCK